MKKHFYRIIQLLLLVYPAIPTAGQTIDSLFTTASSYPIEKIYVHHDRTHYYAGEMIWMKLWQTTGEGAQTASRIAYIDLINDKKQTITQARFPLNDGRGEGCLQLPDSLTSGHYLLRAYTRWMMNAGQESFFTQELTVYGPTSEEASRKEETHPLSFYPEGGYLVEGLTSRMAFELRGDSVVTSSPFVILDNQADTVASVSPMFLGKGIFTFLPQSGKEYTAVLPGYTKQIPLPKALPYGFTLSTQSRGGKMRVILSHNLPPEQIQAHTYSLVLHHDGRLIVQTPIDPKRSSAVLTFPTEELPVGTFTVSLIDESYHAYCERQVFVRYPEQLNLALSVSEERKEDERKIIVELRATDKERNPQSGEFSLAAVKPALEQSASRFNICSYIFLGSEVKGVVRQPEIYWNPSRPESVERIDLLLLTQGWRRYSLEQFASPIKPIHPIEEGLELKGKVDLPRIGKPEGLTVQAMLRQDSLRQYAEIIPDADGQFTLRAEDFSGEKEVWLSARNKEGKDYQIKTSPAWEHPQANIGASALPLRETQQAEWKVNRYIDPRHITDKVWELGEINITARKKMPQEERRLYDSGFIKSSVEIEKDKVQGRVIDYFRKVPGVTLTSSSAHPGFSFVPKINGMSEPAAIVLNGIFQRDPEIVFSMDISMVERIEVLQSTATMFGGFNSASGVICIYTREDWEESVSAKRCVVKWIGYNQTKEFYVPDGNDKEFRLSPFARNTYYWNPTLRTDTNGQAEISFPLNEKEEFPLIHCEGISNNGLTGATVK